MNKTNIEWCDFTWNPIVGCTHGCPYCYARRQAKRQPCEKCREFIPHFHPERLEQPLKRKKPSRIFCGSMCDFWGEGVEKEWRRDIFVYIHHTQQHQYLLLTKQPQNIIQPTEGKHHQDAFPNLWQGVSVTVFDDLWRVNRLVEKVPARQVVSFEPLLGYFPPAVLLGMPQVDWIICGAQTKPNRQPQPNQVYWLKEYCEDAGIPLFMKDNLNYEPKIQQYPEGW